jgi:hypothetical protein
MLSQGVYSMAKKHRVINRIHKKLNEDTQVVELYCYFDNKLTTFAEAQETIKKEREQWVRRIKK